MFLYDCWGKNDTLFYGLKFDTLFGTKLDITLGLLEVGCCADNVPVGNWWSPNCISGLSEMFFILRTEIVASFLDAPKIEFGSESIFDFLNIIWIIILYHKIIIQIKT